MAIQEIKNYAMQCDVCGEYADEDITPIPPDNNWNYVRSWYKNHRQWAYRKSKDGDMIDVCPNCDDK